MIVSGMARRAAACLVLAFTGAGAAPPTAYAAEAPATLQDLRRHMLDANVNALTFQSMDRIFDTRRVAAPAQAAGLPRAPATPDFVYEYGGARHSFEEGLERTYTNAFLVIKDGRIVTEVYRNLSDERTHFVSFSMAKSITSLLIGLAVADGRIQSIQDPVTRYLPELKGSAYDGVSIRDVLMMRSGVDYEERYDFQRPGMATTTFEQSLVRGQIPFADFARIVPRREAPGLRFNYSTLDTGVLGALLARATGRNLSDYMTEKLWQPLGAESYGFWILQGAVTGGPEFAGAGFNAVLRDYGRLGLMVLNGGKANGRQVVPAAWIAESTKTLTGPDTIWPGNQLGYGYQWWTLLERDEPIAIGLQGQLILVDRKTSTVVVKLSHFPPGDDTALMAESFALLGAAADWKPAAR